DPSLPHKLKVKRCFPAKNVPPIEPIRKLLADYMSGAQFAVCVGASDIIINKGIKLVRNKQRVVNAVRSLVSNFPPFSHWTEKRLRWKRQHVLIIPLGGISPTKQDKSRPRLTRSFTCNKAIKKEMRNTRRGGY